MSAPASRTTPAGEALTMDIIAVVAPLVDGKPCELVIEVVAAAMMAVMTLGCRDQADRITVLRRYAERIEAFAVSAH